VAAVGGAQLQGCTDGSTLQAAPDTWPLFSNTMSRLGVRNLASGATMGRATSDRL
jgi:hypothetical protein